MNWLPKQKMVGVLFCFLVVGSTILVATAEVKKKNGYSCNKKTCGPVDGVI